MYEDIMQLGEDTQSLWMAADNDDVAHALHDAMQALDRAARAARLSEIKERKNV